MNLICFSCRCLLASHAACPDSKGLEPRCPDSQGLERPGFRPAGSSIWQREGRCISMREMTLIFASFISIFRMVWTTRLFLLTEPGSEPQFGPVNLRNHFGR